MVRLSWSLSLFGLEQMSSLLRPQAGVDRAAAACDSVARSAEEQMGSTAQATFQAGDGLQRRLVDLAFDLLSPGAWNRDRALEMGSGAVRRTTMAGVAAMRRSAADVSQVVKGGSVGAQGSPQATGWGPMPG
jgi:hypothetical protein